MKRYYMILLLAIGVVNCDADSASTTVSSGTPDGQGGSLATFALKGNYLYTVDETDLNVFNITETTNPVLVNNVPIGFDIETLFSYKDYLYMGSRTGMFIYEISTPEFPKRLADVQHFTACDPVVANDTFAFVSLHSNTECGADINVLEVYDVTTIENPVLINSRGLVAPKGLGLYGDYLIVCDDEIKVFEISDPNSSNPNAAKFITSINKNAFDVIIHGDLLIAIGTSGVYQYRLSTSNLGIAIQELSTIDI